MKLYTAETIGQRKERLNKWHRWFAWHPASINRDDGKFDVVWFQTLERRGKAWHSIYDGIDWEYRYPEKS